MRKIVVINGSGHWGKDSFVEYCSSFLPETRHTSYVDYIRYEVAPLLGYEGGKTEKDRKFLSDILDISAEYNDLPYSIIDKEIQKFFNETLRDDAVLFIDIRQPSVIQRVVNDYGAKTLLVTRSDVPKITSNHADAEVENYNYDWVIANDGTLENLRHAAEIFCKEKLFKSKLKCDTECIDCNYNVTSGRNVACGKSDILSTIDTVLKGYNPKNMVPISYDMLKEIADELKKRRMEE